MKKYLTLFILLFLTACPPDMGNDTDTLFSETSEICIIGNEGCLCLEEKCTDGSTCIYVSHANINICVDLDNDPITSG